MPTMETVAVVLFAGLLLSLSPGPSMIYVLSRTLALGRAAGFAAAIGLAVGGTLLAVVTALGLTSIFQASDAAYNAIKWMGALYLIYLGARTLFGVYRPACQEKTRRENLVNNTSWVQLLGQGVVVEVLNPKTILFFLAFIPQFVEIDRGNVTLQMLVLGVMVPLTAIPSDIVLAVAGGAVVNRFRGSQRVASFLEICAGVLLVAIGISLYLDFP